MFGSLRPVRRGPEESRIYREHLCACCHAMHEVGGRSTSLLTNYDQTLLAIVLSGLVPEREAEPFACTALPWRTVAVRPLPRELRALLAAGNLALADAKLRDDIDDGGGLMPRAVRTVLRGKTRRSTALLRALGFPVSLIDELPARQRAVERLESPDLERTAAPTAELLGQIFAHGALLARRRDVVGLLRELGEAIGRLVYWYDALDDYRDDRRRGRFNAVFAFAGRVGLVESLAQAMTGMRREAVRAREAAVPVLDPERSSMLGAVLDGLVLRAEGAAERIAGASRSRLRLRSAEAGDCDVPCDCGPGDCGTGDCDCHYCPVDCCWAPGEHQKGKRRVGVRRRKKVRDAKFAAGNLQVLVGLAGEAVTDVRENGRVEVDGAVYDAFTTGPARMAGQSIVVNEVAEGRLRVSGGPPRPAE